MFLWNGRVWLACRFNDDGYIEQKGIAVYSIITNTLENIIPFSLNEGEEIEKPNDFTWEQEPETGNEE